MKKDFKKGTGQKLYQKALKIIPGGTQLLSKRPEMFLPEQWPAYYSKAKGCEVWDLDGNHYYDMGRMAVGSCLLGYADKDVNKAVKDAVDRGSMSTLNAPEEVELAELLCKIHPWADMARFARGGGEAMAVAVRIARAYTDRDIIAFCGYHGWADWYLATNLGTTDGLKEHLLAGLDAKGVPPGLKGSILPFRYNHLEELEAIVKHAGNRLAAIVMEPLHSEEPKDDFLKKIRTIADKSGAVLIFDEVSIGWKLNYGGAHLIYGVTPDIAVFSKAMSNGFPMAAIIGKREVMQAAQGSFISSTYWTDRIGPAAALATLKKMKKVNVPKRIAAAAAMMRDGWAKTALKHGLKIKVGGTVPYNNFSFLYEDAAALKTLFTQEMLERGFLASTEFNPSVAHTPVLIKRYLKALDGVFAEIRTALDTDSVQKRLKGPIAHSHFARLN
jgi:glutamate-1-semialdehyde 2,1-aminomutase